MYSSFLGFVGRIERVIPFLGLSRWVGGIVGPGLQFNRLWRDGALRLVNRFALSSCVLMGIGFAAHAASSLDAAALDRLFAAAEQKQSNALFVHERGEPVREQFFDAKDRRIYLFSVTKVFAALAVGIAWDRGLIPSIEEPVSRYFPDANKDPQFGQIRIRHLLQHTSGIETTQGSRDIYPRKDFVRFALESPVVTSPGEIYAYNNRAINIVSGIIRLASGKSMEEFLVEHLFKPLEIRDYRFGRDKTGNTWAMDGLELRGSDLIKIATVIADNGRWRGRQIVSERWLDVATQGNLIRLHRSAPAGLGLFCVDIDGAVVIPATTVEALARSGLEEPLISRFRSVSGREFPKASELGQTLQATFNPSELEKIAAAAGREMVPVYRKPRGRTLVYHDGEFGVILVAVPRTGIAVARTIDEKRGRGKPNGFEEIYSLTARLLPPLPQ